MERFVHGDNNGQPGILDDLVIVSGLDYWIDVIVHRDTKRETFEKLFFTKSIISLEIRYFCRDPYNVDHPVWGLEVILPGTMSFLLHGVRRSSSAR